MRRVPPIVWIALVSACSSSQGGEGQACYANGTCNAGLTCLSKLCVNAGTDSGTPGSDGGGNPDSGTRDAGPPPPTLGTAIDRAGRPGINLLLTDPFDQSATTKGQQLDSYNQTAITGWSPFTPWIQSSLGIYDGFDGFCGNQLGAAAPVTATRYQVLAQLLDDDRLYLDTSKTTCVQYFGVELNQFGAANADCGGLTPLENAMDTTYSLLITGQLSAISNGITSDAHHTASTTAFPYLAAPN
jgi:hypothetical protein